MAAVRSQTAHWRDVPVFVCLLLSAHTVRAEGIRQDGPIINLSEGQGTLWCTTAYGGPPTDAFLALWLNLGASQPRQMKGRCIAASTGAFAGPEFEVSPGWSGLGVPVFVPSQTCWAVTYHTDHELGGDICFQKVGVSGKIGSSRFLVQEASDQQTPHMDRDSGRNRFFVAWADYRDGRPQIRGRLFDADGATVTGAQEVRVGEATGYHQTDPMVVYNPLRDEFFVIWADYRNEVYRTSDLENNYVDIYGQRISAATGVPNGPNVPVHSPILSGFPYITDEQDTPAGLQCNTNTASPLYGTYFVGIQKLEKLTGTGWTTKGRILNSDASPRGNAFSISYPNRGGAAGCAYSHHDDTYMTTYIDWRLNISAQQFSASGAALLGPTPVFGLPEWEKNYGWLAVRPGDGECLQVTTLFENMVTQERRYALVAQRFLRDATPPAPVSEFTATPGLRRVTLRWRNPADADFQGVLIRVRNDACPVSSSDGQLLVAQLGSPGALDSFVHASLVPGSTRYYAVFPHDRTANFASAPCLSVTVGAPGDTDLDADVDQSDFGFFQGCLSGDGKLHASGCEDADFDTDGDVDGTDLTSFRNCMGGANRPPGC